MEENLVLTPQQLLHEAKQEAINAAKDFIDYGVYPTDAIKKIKKCKDRVELDRLMSTYRNRAFA